ncbi:MAG: ion transporter [Actinomycetota bacterium]|nr:ion transporter [Actinomycetota bacterium]
MQWFVVGVIAFNAVVLGALTTPWGRGSGHWILSLLDNACLAIFVCEISCKLIAVGPRFFRSGWNIFDFVVVAVSLVVFYIAAVMATSMFGEKFPEWFGDLGASAYTLFQIMTLESWSMGIVRPVMEVYPWAWAFFVPFIVLSAFTVLNLFLAVIVDSMQAIQRKDDPAAESSEAAGTEASVAPALSGEETAELRQEIADLRTSITLLHAELRAGETDQLADPR